MRHVPIRLATSLFLLCAALTASAQDMMTEAFEGQPETRWRVFTDGVMGGESSGQVTFERAQGAAYAHLTGTVSTANNGGFIQMRRDLPEGAFEGATGIRLIVRGNTQRYFVHLRTKGTVLPWQYYQGGFDVTREWTEIRLPLTRFERSGRMLRATPRAGSLTSVAIVAFGRDHTADIEIREVGVY